MSDQGAHRQPGAQLRLPLEREPSFDRALFVVSDCNRDAVDALDAWPRWPGGCLVLYGPAGAGKSHLARSWAARSGAAAAAVGAGRRCIPPNGPVLIEDADHVADETVLFHLINRAETGQSLLMTSRLAPRHWPVALPDLPSRLNALLAVGIGLPDDTVLRAVLARFFRDRNIRPEQDVFDFLLRRMERSVPAARSLVTRLDEVADASGRGVTRALARDVLDMDSDAPEPKPQSCD